MKNIWQEIINIVNKTDRNVNIISGNESIGQDECEQLNVPIDSVFFEYSVK